MLRVWPLLTVEVWDEEERDVVISGFHGDSVWENANEIDQQVRTGSAWGAACVLAGKMPSPFQLVDFFPRKSDCRHK